MKKDNSDAAPIAVNFTIITGFDWPPAAAVGAVIIIIIIIVGFCVKVVR